MLYKNHYQTPAQFSDIILLSDGRFLTGLYFEGGRYVQERSAGAVCGAENIPPAAAAVFKETSRWLDIYFSGRQPDFTPQYKIYGATPFRQKVISTMLEIPYGKTVTYKDIAGKIAPDMSAQAAGGAVGWNPICIIIPCHRVMGAGNSLTGYGGGLKNKKALLELEGLHIQQV